MISAIKLFAQKKAPCCGCPLTALDDGSTLFFNLRIGHGEIKFKPASLGFFEQYGYTLQTLKQALNNKAFFQSDEPQILQDVKEKLLHAMDCRTAYKASIQICLPRAVPSGSRWVPGRLDGQQTTFLFCVSVRKKRQQNNL